MSKFFLIDPSIRKIGGHYYEYAVHVLRAALAAGDDCVLGVNKRFVSDEPLPWRVVRAFRYGHFVRLTPPWWLQPINLLRRGAHDLLVSLITKKLYSKIGFLLKLRGNAIGFICAQPLRSPGRLLLFIFSLILLSPVMLAIGICKLLIPRFLREKSGDGLYKIRRKVGRIITYRPPYFVKVWLQETLQMWAFYRDLRRMFRASSLAEGDIVFFPTISTAEMLALASFLRRFPVARKANWHLLFRYNLYQGRPAGYRDQDESLRRVRNRFLRFLSASRGCNVTFYTDTNELTNQFKRMGIGTFHTLPIPHTRPPIAVKASAEGPLRVCYVGDARLEKGYQYLPRIVEDLWQDYAVKGKVEFVFQSNYNVPAGEPEAVVARNQLSFYPSPQVQLLSQPLSSTEYAELLGSAHINLLPYNRDSYFARSSGIFIESLAAQVPVIVPAASWMAEQLTDQITSYHDKILESVNILQSFSHAELSWQRQEIQDEEDGKPIYGKLETAEIGEQLVARKGERLICREMPISPGGNYLLCQADFFPYHESPFVAVYIYQRGEKGELLARKKTILGVGATSPRSSLLIPVLEGVTSVDIALQPAFEAFAVILDQFNVDVLDSHEIGSIPLSAVGLTYSDPDDISVLVREMINHYDHYRKSVERFSSTIISEHNARELLYRLKHDGQPELPVDPTGNSLFEVAKKQEVLS